MFLLHLLFLFLLFLLLLLLSPSLVVSTVDFEPSRALMTEDEDFSVSYSYQNLSSPPGHCHFHLSSSDTGVATVASAANITNHCSGMGEGNFTVRGHFIGHCNIAVVTGEVVVADYQVSVKRRHRVVDTAFVIVVAVMVALNTAAFGCTLQLSVVKEVLRKPVAPAIGAIGQFILMPLMAYALTQLSSLQDYLQLGLFTMGCTPGGGASNIWTMLLDGDISLSITMTFISTCLALVTMPMWLLTLGSSLVEGRDIYVPYADIAKSLALLIGPLLVGLLLKHYKENWAKKIAGIIKPICVILVLFNLTVGIYSNLYVFYLLTARIMIVSICLPWFGFLLAGAAAYFARLPWYRVKTVGIETGIQNTALALVLLRVSLDQPDGDLASAVPIAVNIVTPLPLILIFIVRTAWMRWKLKKGGDNEVDDLKISGNNEMRSQDELSKDENKSVQISDISNTVEVSKNSSKM